MPLEVTIEITWLVLLDSPADAVALARTCHAMHDAFHFNPYWGRVAGVNQWMPPSSYSGGKRAGGARRHNSSTVSMILTKNKKQVAAICWGCLSAVSGGKKHMGVPVGPGIVKTFCTDCLPMAYDLFEWVRQASTEDAKYKTAVGRQDMISKTVIKSDPFLRNANLESLRTVSRGQTRHDYMLHEVLISHRRMSGGLPYMDKLLEKRKEPKRRQNIEIIKDMLKDAEIATGLKFPFDPEEDLEGSVELYGPKCMIRAVAVIMWKSRMAESKSTTMIEVPTHRKFNGFIDWAQKDSVVQIVKRLWNATCDKFDRAREIMKSSIPPNVKLTFRQIMLITCLSNAVNDFKVNLDEMREDIKEINIDHAILRFASTSDFRWSVEPDIKQAAIAYAKIRFERMHIKGPLAGWELMGISQESMEHVENAIRST